MERRTHGTNWNGKVEYLHGQAVDIEEGPEECPLLRPLLSKGMGKGGGRVGLSRQWCAVKQHGRIQLKRLKF